MRIVIVTHNSDRHFYFCNKLIENTDTVVGVITGAKYNYSPKLTKIKKALRNFFPLVNKFFLDLLYKKWGQRLTKEKIDTEEIFFNNQKNYFQSNYKDLLIGEVRQETGSINNDSFVKRIRDENPDVIIVMGTCLLGKDIINSAQYVLNIHTGLSPYYRGGNTNFWPFIFKEFDHFGVTVHKLSTGIDSGDIIYNRQVSFENGDTYSSINCKAIILGTELMIKAIKDIEEKDINFIPQWEKGRLFLNMHFNNLIVKRYFNVLENDIYSQFKEIESTKSEIKTY